MADPLSAFSAHSLVDAITSSGVSASFVERPGPVEADLRITWRVALLAITLRLCCRGGQSSLRRLHVLNWSTRTLATRQRLLAALAGERRPQDIVIRTDPVLNQVVDFAVGEKLVVFPRGDRIRLSARGVEIADALIADAELMVAEKQFLQALGKSVTEEWITLLMSPVGSI